MNLAMCEVPVHPVEHLQSSVLAALPELPMTQAEDGTWYCDGESTQVVQEQGKNIVNCADNVNTNFTEDEGSLTGSGWGVVIFDNAWVIKNLKPSTTYYGKMTITMNEVVAEKTVYSLSKRITLYRSSNSQAGAFSTNMFGNHIKTLSNGESADVNTNFTTPDDLMDLKAVIYTELYTDEDGTGGYCSNVTFSNIMLSEQDLPYEPFQPKMPSPDYQSPITNTYPAGTYKAICGDKVYKVVLDDDLRSVPGTADRVTIDAGKGVMRVERKIEQITLTGNEIMADVADYLYAVYFQKMITGWQTSMCNRFINNDRTIPDANLYGVYSDHPSADHKYFRVNGMGIESRDDFRNWLKNNETILNYALAEKYWTTTKSIPTQLVTISTGQSAQIVNTVNDKADYLAVRGDSWQLQQEQGKNLFNIDGFVSTGSNIKFQYSNNGIVLDNSDNKAANYGYFPVTSALLQGGKTYTSKVDVNYSTVQDGGISAGSMFGVFFLQDNISFSSNTKYAIFGKQNPSLPTSGTNYITFTLPDDISGLPYITTRVAGYSTIEFSNMVIVEGSYTKDDFPIEDYEPFNPAMPSPEYPSEIVSVGGKMQSCGWNLFDVERFVDNYNKNSSLGKISAVDDSSITVGQENYMENLTRIDFGFIDDAIYKFSCNVDWIETANVKGFFHFRFIFNDGTIETIAVSYSDQKPNYETVLSKSGLKYFEIGVWGYHGKVLIKNIKLQPSNLPYDRHRGNSITLPTLRGLPDGTRDVLYVDRRNKRAWVERKVGLVESYNGESVGDLFMSNTGELSTGAVVHYKLATPVTEELPYSDYLLDTCQWETNLFVDCDKNLVPEIEVGCKVLGR